MKRTITIMMALLVALGLTQCKKTEQPTTDNTENTFNITLSVGNNGNSKADVNPLAGTVVFEAGDIIYVGSGGKYVGSLTHDGNHHFAGSITNPVEGEPLQFFFLGNVTPEEVLGAGSTEECSVIISDQTEHLPVISCAPSNENFSFINQTYTAHLLNKCALVKFLVTTPANAPICVNGMHNKVTVDFLNNTLTTSVDGDGAIMLPAGYGENVEHWAILLPQDALDAGEEGSIYSLGGNYVGTRPAMPAVVENGYWSDGVAITADIEVFPIGATKGLFTINEAGTQVFFSKGNLQYIGSVAEPYWKFAEHQWDCFAEFTEQNSVNENVDRDLFGWGTSGYNHNNGGSYQPWSMGSYTTHYAYGSSTYNLYDQTGQADWGYNAIANGGNQENSGWRTLTKNEWNYIINSRTDAESKMGFGKVCGVNGMILLPDEWTLPEGLNFTSGNSDWANVYSSEQWTLMEIHNAVFLPAAGSRNGTSVREVGVYGYYWSGTPSSGNSASSSALCLNFGSNYLYVYGLLRNLGQSVRLVRNAQ